ncbi:MULTISPECIES: glycoside hydrolase family 31 protein [Exiguobacterium]|uniref:glycoside hydrolase family 31 protein n=1 Tax=Exiguobacterium TaxID=33986 RepID=UPI001BEC3C92|nr:MULTISPECIES: glycoside hydrolase family 31 protein [Exiguobacterium]MCT4781938.1 glycoside hydrolase family 31 protein [Exiguobacterium himgiriensis]
MRLFEQDNVYTKQMKPNADDRAIVQGSCYRFTVLTSQLIRMEYAEDGIFEDRPTQVVWNRAFDVPDFRVVENEHELQIITEHVHLYYVKGPFAPNTLYVDVKGNFSTYYSRYMFHGTERTLKGTARTLDHVDGAVELEEGIASKQGYAVIDDSTSFIMTEDRFVEPRRKGIHDLYYFGYGHEYRQALRDFYQLTGPTPLLPRKALGNWWSRYWRYDETEYKSLMHRFKTEDIPFSVSVIDMDWHVTDIPEEYGSGWTGYSWNKNLFPDPKGFLSWLKEEGFLVTLNLHPADGVRAFEDQYAAMAEAMGIDPETGDRIPFDFSDKRFIQSYFEQMHHPHEADGVDFWWIDWQQGSTSKMEGLDPLWMLNHYHAVDIARDGNRPLIFSRYAGPGSHRYPVGFSGDTLISWASLAFQPYFTATASNIGYGWWSHDIGGHYRGVKDDELAARWVAFGVFSPITRLHSTFSIFNGKEPWRFGMEAEQAMKQFLRLRHQLVPYLYTMNWRNHMDATPLILPMYYDHPEDEMAYEAPNQYYFGSELVVAPIVVKRNDRLHVAPANVWLPEGDWFDFFTGHHYVGGKSVRAFRRLDEQAVFAKAGAIVPMAAHHPGSNDTDNPSELEVVVFPGASNTFTLFEDNGTDRSYETGAYAETTFTLDWETRRLHIRVSGDTTVLPEERNITLLVRGVKAEGEYERATQTLRIELGPIEEELTVELPVELTTNDNRLDRLYQFLDRAEIAYDLKDRLYRSAAAKTRLEAWLFDLHALELDRDLQDAIMELMLD